MHTKLSSPLSVLMVLVSVGAARSEPLTRGPADEVRTGRSVAVGKAPAHDYWLSRDLNRLFLQRPAENEPSASPAR